MGIEVAIGAAVAGLTAGSTAAAIGFSWAAAGISLALGALSSVLTPKPKTPNLSGFSAQASGFTENVRQPITERRTLYGEARIGGALTFIETTDNNKYLHMILTLCDHEVSSIGEIWFNDKSIPEDYIDGSGNVISGDYKNKARIKKYLGTTTQTADSDLVSETSATSNFRGRGVSYIYLRLQYDRDIYPSIPTITAWVKGKKITDTRDSVEKWTPNAALIARDYLIQPINDLTPGIGVDSSNIDETVLNASANACEEYVTTTAVNSDFSSVDTTLNTFTAGDSRLVFQTGDRVQLTTGVVGGVTPGDDYYVIPYQRKDNVRFKIAETLEDALNGVEVSLTSGTTGTITKNAEPRFFSGGILETTNTPKDNLNDILSAMGGSAVYIGGKWTIMAASYTPPVYSFDENDIISNITIRPKNNRRDRFNLVKGVYVSPLNDGQPSDYPFITNSSYVSADNGVTLPIDLDLPMTQRPHTAQRLAKIKLEKHRQELFVQASFSLQAMQVQPGDTINITNSRMGWTNKIFEVVEWSLENTNSQDAPVFFVNMSLQETSSTVYDWNNGEETLVDPAPNTNLPDPLLVEVVGGFSLDSILIDTQGLDKTYKVIASWDISDNAFVASGGQYEVEWKRSTETDYKSNARVDGSITSVQVPQLEPNVLYDLRIFAYNDLGVRSAQTIIEGFQVGSTVTTDTEDWENETLSRDGQDWETDTLTSEDWEA